MWVQLQFEASYIYLGLEESIFLYYPLKENFNIGITTGIQYIFNRKIFTKLHAADMKSFYLGVGLDVKI